MASEYNLALKATLDTSQVQQELQRLKQSYKVGSEDGNSFSKGVQGKTNMQKLEVQLTRLGQSITGLQRAIEQLARSYNRTATPGNSQQATNGQDAPPIAPPKSSNGKPKLKNWLDSKEYRKFNNEIKRILEEGFEAESLIKFMHEVGIKDLRDPLLADKVLSTPSGKETFKYILDYNKEIANFEAKKQEVQKKLQAKQQEALKMQQAQMRQNREIASMIGGQLFGGAANIASSLGYTGTANVLGAVGSGFTAGGGVAMTASMLGAGSAAGPIGIVVGLAAAAGSVVSALKQLEESAKKTAEQQEKVAEALKESARSQYVQRYGAWQQIRADQVRKENNLTVAQERESYFKEQLEKARRSYFGLQNPEDFERKTREEAAKKKAEKVNRTIIATPGTAGGGSYSYTTVSDKYSAEEKQKIDEAANKAIEAQQKKVQAAKIELDAAQQNYNLWKDVAYYLKNSKDEAAKAERDSKNAEYAKRRQLREGALFASEAYIQSDRIRSTQIMAMDIMNNKLSGPLEKFNKIAEELDRLRSDRKSLVEKAYGINKDIAKGERDSNELADMIKRRDMLLKDASFIAERADILENALGSISTGTVAPDLSHVTSLAQYGFNMGEKDDSVERMEKYYNKSLNLQQQIKDKLQEGVKTEAVYN